MRPSGDLCRIIYAIGRLTSYALFIPTPARSGSIAQPHRRKTVLLSNHFLFADRFANPTLMRNGRPTRAIDCQYKGRLEIQLFVQERDHRDGRSRRELAQN